MNWYKIESYDHDGNEIIYGSSEKDIDELVSDNIEPSFVKISNCCYYSENKKKFVSYEAWENICENSKYIRRKSIVKVTPLKGDPTLTYAKGEMFIKDSDPFNMYFSDTFAENTKFIEDILKSISLLRDKMSEKYDVRIPRLRIRDWGILEHYEFQINIFQEVVRRGTFKEELFKETILSTLEEVINLHYKKFIY